MYTLKCGYGEVLNNEVEKYCPDMFRNELRVPDFYLNIVKSKGYSFMMETIFQLHKKNIPIVEIPIKFTDREKGVSKIPRIEMIRTLINLFRIKFFN
mgnify:CR=1 FL=1